MANGDHHEVLIIGGGAAGVSVAASLARKEPKLDIAIVEPSNFHYYQPGFTLVGAGVFTLEQTRYREATLIPKRVTWIRERAASFAPEDNAVTLASGERLTYNYLVVCPGLQIDLDKVQGLRETLGRNGVCTNYLPEYAPYTWQCISNFAGGRALFTQPPMPIKCAGAPQKALYLAADHFRRKGLLPRTTLEFLLHAPVIFSVPYFAERLVKVTARYGAVLRYKHNLVAIDGQNKTATFEVEDGNGAKTRVTKEFDMIHVTPPQSAPDFVKASPLANSAGWVDVHPNTLQHVRYRNVFALGDVGSTPNSKTAAAVRKQAPVAVRNLLALRAGESLAPSYDGYASCPLTTAYGKVMLAEFIYEGKVTPTFPGDPGKERRSMWLLKKYGLAPLYKSYMLKGIEWDIPHNTKFKTA